MRSVSVISSRPLDLDQWATRLRSAGFEVWRGPPSAADLIAEDANGRIYVNMRPRGSALEEYDAKALEDLVAALPNPTSFVSLDYTETTSLCAVLEIISHHEAPDVWLETDFFERTRLTTWRSLLDKL